MIITATLLLSLSIISGNRKFKGKKSQLQQNRQLWERRVSLCPYGCSVPGGEMPGATDTSPLGANSPGTALNLQERNVSCTAQHSYLHKQKILSWRQRIMLQDLCGRTPLTQCRREDLPSPSVPGPTVTVPKLRCSCSDAPGDALSLLRQTPLQTRSWTQQT